MTSGPFDEHSRFELRRLASVAEVRLGKMLQSAPAGPTDRAVPYLRAGSLGSLGRSADLPEMFASPRDSAQYAVREGDLVVAEGGDVGRTALVPGDLNEPTIIQNSLHRVRARQGGVRFLRYALDAVYASGWLDVVCNRSTFGHLTVDKLSAMSIPWPSPTEQRALADYLDNETARIDALIAQKQRLMQATSLRLGIVRHHIVTSAETAGRRNAGWLGTVPEHWAVTSLRRVAKLHMGTTFPHEFQGKHVGELPVVKVGDLGRVDASGVLHSSGNWIDESTAHHLKARIVPPMSVLYARVGAAMLLNPRAMNPWPCMLDDNVRAVEFHGTLPRFGLEVLRLLDLGELTNPGPVPSIGEEQVMSIRFPLPPLDEQRRIVDAAQREAQREDRLRVSLQRQLSLLVEHRRALITAAVTGELEIPGVA